MTRITAVTVLVLVLLAPIGGAAIAASQQSMVTLTVTVLDGGDNPISNVELAASWDGGSTEGTTRANGQALIDVPRGADVTIRVSHAIYVRNNPFVLEDAREESVTVRVARRASATLTIVDDEGPVPDAAVRLRKDGEIAAVGSTDQDGDFETGTIEAGDYTINVRKVGYRDLTTTLTIRGDVTEEIQLQSGTVPVTFRVVDRNFDPPRPVTDATITGSGIGTVQTQSNGVQQISAPVNSELTVSVTKDGYRTVDSTIQVEEQPLTVNISTRKLPALSLDLLNSQVVVGQQTRVVVRDQYDAPVDGASVRLDGSQIGTTGDSGEVLVPIDSPGEHTVSASTGDLTTDTHEVFGVRPIPADAAQASNGSDGGSGLPGVSGGVLTLGGTTIHLQSVLIGIVVGIVLLAVTTLWGYGKIRR